MRVDDKKKEKEEHQTAQQQPDFLSQVPCDLYQITPLLCTLVSSSGK